MVTVVAVTPGADAVLPPPVLELPQAAVSSTAAPLAAATAQVLDLLISGRMPLLLVCVDTGCRCHCEGASGAAGSPAVRRVERNIRVAPLLMDATPPATPRGNARIATIRTIP